MKNRLILYYYTVKYYKLRQIYLRIIIKLKKSILNVFDVKKRYYKLLKKNPLNDLALKKNIHRCSINLNNTIKNEIIFQKIISTTNEIFEKQEFTFLNLTVGFNTKINWTSDYPSRLWGYNLNYFNFLLPVSIYINVEKDIINCEKINNILYQWIKVYDYKHNVLSSPYVVSLRIFNLLYFILLTNKIKKYNSLSNIIEYMYMDFLFLSNNLELDIKGNHLIKNLKSLIILGYFFNTKISVRIAKNSIKLLLKEADEQILKDGGHFERSIMYHVIVTQDFLEIIYFLRLLNITVPDELRAKSGLMLDFLEAVTHPDGDIGLFNDSAFNIAAQASDVLYAGAKLLDKEPSVYAKPGLLSYLFAYEMKSLKSKELLQTSERFNARPYSGYFALSNSCGKMILDCGDLAPDYLPGHAHNDMLSFELSIKDRRYIVDTGVYEYEPGFFRDKCRSTLSHNTVAINGAEQSEQWASFRMARRGRITRCEWKERNDYNIVSAARSQYNSKKSFHRRTVIEHQDGFWIVLDNIQATGKLPHYSHLHLHPEINPVVTPKGIIADQLVIQPFSVDSNYDVNILKNLYFPEFGLKQERISIRISTHAGICGYVLIAHLINDFKIVLRQSTIHLSLDNRDYELDLQPLFQKDEKGVYK